MVTTAQLADAASAVFAAESAANSARSLCERLMPVHSWSIPSNEFLDAREALKCANMEISKARGAQAELIRRWEVQ